MLYIVYKQDTVMKTEMRLLMNFLMQILDERRKFEMLWKLSFVIGMCTQIDY